MLHSLFKDHKTSAVLVLDRAVIDIGDIDVSIKMSCNQDIQYAILYLMCKI